MKKVLFMLSSMNIGGVEKSLLSLLAVMPKEKYDITLLLLEKKGDLLESVPDWVKVEEVAWYKQVKPIIMQPPQTTVKDYTKNKETLKIPAFLYAYMISEKLLKNKYIFYKNTLKHIPIFDQEFHTAIAYQGPTDIIDFFIANKVQAKKKISWVHFDVSKHAINKKLYATLYKKFDKVYAVSKEARNKLMEIIPSVSSKAEVFHNIVSESFIQKLSKREVDFEADYQGTKIVTVGRLSKEKGQDLAIKALAKLREDGYDVKWYCIGEGKQRKEYEQLIEVYGLKEHFILMGSKQNPYPFIASSDIYVQPSRHEGYCLTLAEARCLNKPIVTTDFIGAYEQIKNRYDGWIVHGSENGLYEGIRCLLDNPDQKQLFTHILSESKMHTTNEINKLLNFMNDDINVPQEVCNIERDDQKTIKAF